MKIRGCTSQRKTTKVRLAPQPGQGPGAGSGPPRPAPARWGWSLRSCPGCLRFARAVGPGPDPRETERKIPAPPPLVPASSAHVFPMKYQARGKSSPSVCVQPRFFTFAWKAQLPGLPRVEKGAPPSFNPAAGVPRFARGAAGSARAHPAPGRPRARAAARRPTGFQGPLPWAARSEAQGTSDADVSLRLTPTAHLHPPASPLSLTPRVPTPHVFLFAPTYRLASKDVSGKNRRCVGFDFSCFKEIKGVPSSQGSILVPSVLQASPSWASSVTSSPCEGRKAFK